ncbi:MAG: hypothetical protein R3E00_03345 [Paracoccaceae bacterium]
MRETISIATLFLLLALAGIESGQAEVTKTCKSGAIALALGGC